MAGKVNREGGNFSGIFGFFEKKEEKLRPGRMKFGRNLSQRLFFTQRHGAHGGIFQENILKHKIMIYL